MKESKVIPFLSLYMVAVNKIDDLFEYRYRSMTPDEIKAKVMGYIDEITSSMREIERKAHYEKFGDD